MGICVTVCVYLIIRVKRLPKDEQEEPNTLTKTPVGQRGWKLVLISVQRGGEISNNFMQQLRSLTKLDIRSQTTVELMNIALLISCEMFSSIWMILFRERHCLKHQFFNTWTFLNCEFLQRSRLLALCIYLFYFLPDLFQIEYFNIVLLFNIVILCSVIYYFNIFAT